MYDYKFEVNTSDDLPSIYLGYNVGEDPDWAAQRFVTKNQLPPVYLQKVRLPQLTRQSSNHSISDRGLPQGERARAGCRRRMGAHRRRNRPAKLVLRRPLLRNRALHAREEERRSGGEAAARAEGADSRQRGTRQAATGRGRDAHRQADQGGRHRRSGESIDY